MPLSIIILIIVLIAISIRKIGPYTLPIWLVMSAGAATTLATLQISISSAWHSIDWNIIGYLAGVFIIGQGLEESGLLYRFNERLFAHAHNGKTFMLSMIFIFGLSAALLMNDTIAIIATPLLLAIAQENDLNPAPLLVALAFSITIGSTLSPIGNPQNLLIATKGNMLHPFGDFLTHLTIPTLISLFVCWLLFWISYRKTIFNKPISAHIDSGHHPHLSKLCKISILLMTLLIIIKIIINAIYKQPYISFSAITLTSCTPIVLFSKKRLTILKKMDWHTLVFFISMFILMQSVWDGGLIQHYMKIAHIDITHIPTIFVISTILSQLISNVPLVALYLPLLAHHHATTQQLLALAAGSTIAGNFLVIGAASNIIIIQNSEKRGTNTFSSWEFMRLGIPLGLVCLIIYWIFL